jgi:hypothetical protein
MEEDKGMSHAMVFTDAVGQVVFVNQYFTRLVNRFGARAIVREPLYRVMGIDVDLATQLLRDISKQGSIRDREMELLNVAGEKVPVAVSGLATYDDRRTFVGADMTMVSDGRQLHTDGAAGPLDDQQYSLVEGYFISMLTGLRGLVMRVGGTKFGSTMNVILNETAHRNNWPFYIENNDVDFRTDRMDPDIMRALLARAFSYSSGVIGESIVLKEVKAVDSKTDADVLATIDNTGLRELFVH